MQIIRTNDENEARTCRRAQFAGRVAEITVGGITTSGLVYAVKADPAVTPAQWTITILPKSIPAFKATPKLKLSFC